MIETLSAWNFGHTITKDNKYLNFSEVSDGLERVALLNEGSYTLNQFAIEVARAMNDAAEFNEYSTSVDRSTRKITVEGDTENFTLLAGTGTQLELSPFELMGFSESEGDQSGAQTYEGDSASGFQFIPQFKLQQFTHFEDYVSTSNSNIIENTRGDIVEVVNYGDIRRMKCNIMFQTNRDGQRAIRNDLQGKDKLNAFMLYCRSKARLEFMPDVLAPENFYNCILDKTKLSRNGTDFELYDMISQGWTDYFMTDLIEFREI